MVGADAIYSASRKWMAGPRGVGVLAIRPALAQRLRPRLPPPDWDLPLTVLQRLETGDANIAARVGYSVALGEHLATGPDRIRARLAELGHATRTALAGVAGWRVVEPVGEPTAITTLTPLDGADPQKVRSWLIAERGIVTTYAEMQRAPFELHAPVLRVSPHVDSATRTWRPSPRRWRKRRNYCRNCCESRTVSLSEGIGWPYPVVPNCAANRWVLAVWCSQHHTARLTSWPVSDQH